MGLKISIHWEKWKKHKLFKTVKVSSDGRIKIDNRLVNICVETERGYSTVYIPEINKFRLVHVLVAETFIRPLKDDDSVDHLNRNKRDNSLKNLEIVTKKENLNRAKVGNVSINDIATTDYIKELLTKNKISNKTLVSLINDYIRKHRCLITKDRIEADCPENWWSGYLSVNNLKEDAYDRKDMSKRIKIMAERDRTYLGYKLSITKDNRIVGIKKK